jgi:hypothetical protein
MISSQRRLFAPRLLFKITLPYVALALVLALAALYVVGRMQAIRLASEFSQQLDDAHLRVADSVVRTEHAQLADVRTLSRLNGLTRAMRTGNSRTIQDLVAPYAVSQNIERVMLVDAQGQSLGGVRVNGAGDVIAAANPATTNWPFVAAALQQAGDARGDKYAALVDDDGEAVLYIVTPVYDEDTLAGALLVGTRAHMLVERWRAATLADVTLYGADGAHWRLHSAPTARPFWKPPGLVRCRCAGLSCWGAAITAKS